MSVRLDDVGGGRLSVHWDDGGAVWVCCGTMVRDCLGVLSDDGGGGLFRCVIGRW